MANPTYRTTDMAKWGAGKGSNLDAGEVDENFWAVVQRLVALETNPPAPVNIAAIDVDGDQMVITLEDATAFGPFTLPTTVFRYREDWAPGTAYLQFDVFKVDGRGVYMVQLDHVSADEFDEGALGDDTDSTALYFKIFGFSQPGGMTGSEEVTTQTYTPSATDNGKLKYCTHPGGCLVTIPSQADVDWQPGAAITFMQAAPDGTDRAPVTIEGDTGVTVNWPVAYANETAMQNGMLSAIRVSEDQWVLAGLLATEYATDEPTA